MERGPRRCQNSRADMIMVACVVMATGQVIGLAVLGMKGAVVSLGGHGSGTMLDGLDRRRCGQG